jgi:D-glycero-D-manno-heptose 1,7-bisphosphate phosphatase
MRNAVFLDRDGVINQKAPEGQYVTCWEDMQFLHGVAEAIALLHDHQFLVIVVSNQRCVAKGLLSVEGLEQLHRRMLDHLAERDAPIHAVYYCPHEQQPACTCRKPAPGMLLQAAAEHLLDLPGSWMVGDSDVDIEAGQRAGCRTVRILRDSAVPQMQADFSAPSLLEAARMMIKD